MEFQKGMDLSFIPELEDAGVQVKDFDGTVMDPPRNQNNGNPA